MSKTMDELCVNTIRTLAMAFGASAPLKELQKQFGFVPEHLVGAAKAEIARARR